MTLFKFKFVMFPSFSIPIIIGVAATLFVLAAALLIACFCCRCCPGYKRRQREPKPRTPDPEAGKAGSHTLK